MLPPLDLCAEDTDPAWEAFAQDCRAQAQQPAWMPSAEVPIWVYGAGRFGRDVAVAMRAKGFEVQGFIDQRARCSPVEGLPVCTLEQAGERLRPATVMVAVFNRESPLDVIRQALVAAGVGQVCMPWDFYAGLADALGWRYWLSSPDVFAGALDRIHQAYQCLEPGSSRQRLLDVCRFRMGLNHDYGSFRDDVPQYFNALTLAGKTRCRGYVDGGAFNGDSYRSLCAWMPVDEAWLFEPDADNHRALVAAVSGCTGAHALPLALAARHETLTFSAGAGEAVSVLAGGQSATQTVTAVALDEVLGGSAVDFIKLDLEGGEHAALQGMRQTLLQQRPVLAISAYHQPADVWDLPLLLSQWLQGYRFHLLQHWYNSFESVLYAIPEPC